MLYNVRDKRPFSMSYSCQNNHLHHRGELGAEMDVSKMEIYKVTVIYVTMLNQNNYSVSFAHTNRSL